MSTHTERLEHEAEAARLRLSATVDELRSRLTPGQALDEIIGYGRDGAAGDFVRNLGRDIARNPLPATLAGAGLAWLMLARNGTSNGHANGHGSMRGAMASGRASLAATGEAMAETADDFTDGVLAGTDATAGYVSGQARAAADGVSEMAASARHATTAAYRSASERAQHFGAAVGERSRHAAGRAGEMGRGVIEMCREQPLVLAGVGIALGALLGALLPRTETEDRLVGQASDDVKGEGAALASESYETARSAVRHAEWGTERNEDEQRGGGRMATGTESGLT